MQTDDRHTHINPKSKNIVYVNERPVRLKKNAQSVMKQKYLQNTIEDQREVMATAKDNLHCGG